MSVPPTAEHSALCLNVPFSANGKKRKSTTTVAPEATLHVDVHHTAMHNLDMAEELSLDDELLKHRRLVENYAGSGLCL